VALVVVGKIERTDPIAAQWISERRTGRFAMMDPLEEKPKSAISWNSKR